jgi:hypothetical protein
MTAPASAARKKCQDPDTFLGLSFPIEIEVVMNGRTATANSFLRMLAGWIAATICYFVGFHVTAIWVALM